MGGEPGEALRLRSLCPFQVSARFCVFDKRFSQQTGNHGHAAAVSFYRTPRMLRLLMEEAVTLMD